MQELRKRQETLMLGDLTMPTWWALQNSACVCVSARDSIAEKQFFQLDKRRGVFRDPTWRWVAVRRLRVSVLGICFVSRTKIEVSLTHILYHSLIINAAG